MELQRGAGVLCHISSLPGKYGVGSLGKQAYRFAKRLKASGMRYWQILPLVQTGYGDSPYQSVACTSGNPYFIDLEILKEEGLLTAEELKSAEREGDVDYGDLYKTRYPLLKKAFSRFNFDGTAFRAYVHSGSCEDYALFMTAKTVYGGSFCDWEEGLKRRDAAAVERLRTDHHEEYLFWYFLQYMFDRQWYALKAYCNKIGLSIVGDIPLYVAYDSADVWAHPALFKLGGDLKPEKVAGVPPDYFSETGQLWGNPIYDWRRHAEDGYAWWRARLGDALKRYDVVRIDHFRGIDRYYEIDAGAETAAEGEWKDGPKDALFLGSNCAGRVIAEDLGTVDDGVRSLLGRTGFPGMKVLLFAFDGDPANEHLPTVFGENVVCYTGTHDNDTVRGYFDSLGEEGETVLARVAEEAARLGVKTPVREDTVADVFVQMAFASNAVIAVAPVQDILGLGNEARMNFPGTQGALWKFRLKKQLPRRTVRRLKKSAKIYRR